MPTYWLATSRRNKGDEVAKLANIEVKNGEVPALVFAHLAAALIGDKLIRSATAYINPKLVVKLTAPVYEFRKGRRADDRGSSETFLLTVGKPNYAERKFIEKLQAAGEPFPVKKLQLKFVKGVPREVG
jgi:hypothetical protein